MTDISTSLSYKHDAVNLNFLRQAKVYAYRSAALPHVESVSLTRVHDPADKQDAVRTLVANNEHKGVIGAKNRFWFRHDRS